MPGNLYVPLENRSIDYCPFCGCVHPIGEHPDDSDEAAGAAMIDRPTIRLRETYEIMTEQSAAYGDAEDRGWIDEEGTDYEVRELVERLQGVHWEPSSYPPNYREWSPRDWIMIFYERDYRTGGEETRGLHPATERDARNMGRVLALIHHR